MTFFDNFTNNTRLLILHPNYRLQKPALTNLPISESTVYVRFDGTQLTVDHLNEQLYEAYQKANISALDLVILDECDRAKKAHFDAFLHDLLLHINPTPIVLISRDLSALVLKDSQIRSKTIIWPVNPKLMCPDYLAERKTTIVEVFAFAQYLRVDGVRIENWNDSLSHELFFFLIDKNRIHRQDIFDRFWPHLDPKSAANAFQLAKANITNQLGVEITDYHDYYYTISSAIELYYDVTQYLELVQEADFAQVQAADKLYRDANSLYSGQFLSGINSEWVQKRQLELQAIQADVLANIAKQEIRQGNQDRALLYFGQAAQLAPHREDIARELLRLYLEYAMPCEALVAYHRLERELLGMGITPSLNIEVLGNEASQKCSHS